ncbi:hypothetical protein NJH78_08890 [Pseudomonas chlororaphis]|uniref:hypothetical protein n=1 Tax=Pseudomonas chlororaphis TaxID=587753 RepID=UPI00209B53AC|nr:hypothetical protein [Pseudomonas chlororaphis]MCO7570090.1 hypothetical protein [Pseudomonas chlororaphis]MCO7587237.1 hypothetical protein [Pseudomonas chlororaphis]MCO7610409.1 hypothetical protein [Pseudomonas chlororaphis]
MPAPATPAPALDASQTHCDLERPLADDTSQAAQGPRHHRLNPAHLPQNRAPRVHNPALENSQ